MRTIIVREILFSKFLSNIQLRLRQGSLAKPADGIGPNPITTIGTEIAVNSSLRQSQAPVYPRYPRKTQLQPTFFLARHGGCVFNRPAVLFYLTLSL